MSRRAVVVSLAVAGSVLTLGGCAGAPQSGSGSNVGGSAARSDLLDIGQEELIAEVQAFQEDAGLPENQPAPGLARATLERMIQDQLIQARATQLGVSISPAQVEQARATLESQNGGPEGLASAAQASGIPASSIDDVVRSNLLVSEIGLRLAADGDNNARLIAAQQSLAEFAARLDVEVAPRYGVWDDATLSIKDVSTVTEPRAAQVTQ